MLLDYLPQAAHWALARRASKFFGLCEAADPCLISVLVVGVFVDQDFVSWFFFLFHLSHTYDLSFKTCHFLFLLGATGNVSGLCCKGGEPRCQWSPLLEATAALVWFLLFRRISVHEGYFESRIVHLTSFNKFDASRTVG